MTKLFKTLLIISALSISSVSFAESTNATTESPNSTAGLLVFQSDFGLKDGAVSAMKGVANTVDKNLKLYDLTHEIPAYNIWDASYRLYQTAEYWPTGTVFVSVVDPGVGTTRKSVVLKTKLGQYFVTPDNGTLTLVAEKFGIDEVREIDEAVNRRKNSEKSYTFHGRDVYAFTAARLASGKIKFEEVGKKLPNQVEMITYEKARIENNAFHGNIEALDVQYGNVWTNINREITKGHEFKKGDVYNVEIFNKTNKVFSDKIEFVNSFGDVAEGKNCMYFNSLDNIAIAINMGDFAATHKIEHGGDWKITISKAN